MTRYTPQWLQAGSYAASQDRRLLGALWPTPACTGCQVTAGSAMNLNVAAGQVAVPTPNSTGSTLCSSDATEVVTLSAAPPSGQNRIDIVTCHPRGADLDGGANTDFLFDFITGVPSATPAAPAVPAGQVALAQVLVVGGSASITGANITDVRPPALNMPPGRGVLGRVLGPASTVNVATGFTPVTLLTLAVVVTAGRRYRISVAGFLNIGGASGTSNRNALQVTPTDVSHVSANTGRVQQSGALFGAGIGLNGAFVYTAPTTTTVTFTLAAMIDLGGTVNANAAELTVEDIGT